MTGAVSFDLLEKTGLQERRDRLGDRRRTRARVPDDVGPRRRPVVPDHAQHLTLVDLGQIDVL